MPKTHKISRRKPHKRKNSTKKQHGGNFNMDFMKAIKNADLEFVKTNIARIDDVSFEDADGNTPLDNAINGYNSIAHPIADSDIFKKFTDYHEIIRILLTNGASGENIELISFDFSNMVLENVNLQNSNLRGSNMYNSNLEGAQLQNANLSNVDLENATLELSNLTNTNLDGANLNGTNFKDAVIDGTIFTNTTMEQDDEEYEYEDGEPVDEDDSFIALLNNRNRRNNIQLTTDLDEDAFPDEISDIENNENSDDWMLDLIDTESDNATNQNERLYQLLRRDKVTLQKYNENPFAGIELVKYDVIQMEDINYCDYIKNNVDNIIILYDKQLTFINRARIKSTIDPKDELFDENKIVYKCREVQRAFVPHDNNIITGPALNMDVIAVHGVIVPLEYLDEIVNSDRQIFVIEPVDNIVEMPIASLNTRMGGNVVGTNHCDTNMKIRMGKLSYLDINVLLEECSKKGGKKRKTVGKKHTRKNRKSKKKSIKK